MVDGLAKGVKYAMFAANGVIFIGGLVVFAVGVWTLADRSFMERLLGSKLYVASAALLIAAGVVVAIISFLGSLGAYKEIRCMLLTFFVILFFIFLLMLIGGILGYVFRNQVDERMNREMISTVSLYNNDSAVTEAWDSVQKNFKCCGISVNGAKGYNIYQRNNRPSFGGNGKPKIPSSCCIKQHDLTAINQCVQDPSDINNVFQDDCYDKMKDFVKGHALLVGGIGIGIACILIIEPDEEFEPPFEPRKVVVKKNKEPNKEYSLGEELGRGKFGIVRRCTEKSTKKKLAAKFITVSRLEERKEVEREVDIMRSLQHPRLLQLYDAFDDGKASMCLIMECIDGGELFERVIDDDFVLTEKACTIFMRQICEGIEYVHSQNILHLDMKPENVLCVTRTGNRIKLIDFGLARRFNKNEKLQILFGTPEFSAPEVVNFEQVGFTTDMWAVGVICYVLLSGLSPFMGDSDLETMANVTKAEFDFDDESFDVISEEAKDFISKLLIKNKDQRMTARQCLNHPWLRVSVTPTPPPVPGLSEGSLFEKGKKKKMEQSLDKKKLKKFVIRRRWQKAVNAILALRRMGAFI